MNHRNGSSNIHKLPRVIDTTAFFDARSPEVILKHLLCRWYAFSFSKGIRVWLTHSKHACINSCMVGPQTSRTSFWHVVSKGAHLLLQVRAVQKTVEELQKLRGTQSDSSATSKPPGNRKYRQRRTTSHSRYRHSRRTNAKLLAAAQAAAAEAAESSAVPPLHACTTRPGVPDAAHELSHSEAHPPPNNEADAPASPHQVYIRPTCRAMRRRRTRLQQEVQDSCSGPFDACDTGSRKLETHRWHVKRMSMVLRCNLRRNVISCRQSRRSVAGQSIASDVETKTECFSYS